MRLRDTSPSVEPESSTIQGHLSEQILTRLSTSKLEMLIERKGFFSSADAALSPSHACVLWG